MPTLDDLTSDSDFQQLAPRDQRVLVGRLLDSDSDYRQLNSHDQLVLKNRAQGRFPDATPSQASTSKPFSPTSGNTLPPPSQADLQKQFASSKASNAPITMQTLPMLGKPSGKSTPMMSPEATAAFNKQYQDQLAGNAFYTGSQLNALPNDFTGWLKRTLSGMVTPENMLIGAALPMAPALGPLGVAAEKAAGVYFGAQGVAQGIKVGQKYGVGAGLGAALPFIAPAALGKAGEIVNKRGLPAPPEAQPLAPVQPGRPIVPTEPGTARPPFAGTPTPETATPPPAPTIAPKKGDVLSSDYVFHNTSPEAIAAIEKSGMDSGSFSDKPIKFGQKSYIAIKRSDLPGPVQSHSYGDAISHEPQWETGIDAEGNSIRAAVPANKIMLVDGKGKVIRALGEPPASLQKTPTNIQNNIPVSSEATATAPVNMATPAVEPPVTPETPAVPNPAPTTEPLPPESQSAFDRIKANQAAKQTPAPVETSPQPPTPAKEPWQMTRAEYVNANQSPNIHQKSMAELTHRSYVMKAVRDGEPVPANVLADYPDLQNKENQSGTNKSNSKPEGVGRNNEAVQRGTADSVVHGKTTTAAGKPMERPTETAPTETKTGTPEEPVRTTGIAQRVHDVRNSGAIQPGEGASPEQILGYGRKWIKDGGDPEAHMQMMESRGKSAEGGDIGIVRAQHEILSQATDRASDASRAKPLDKNLKDAYNTAKQAETDWAKRIKPFQTEWQKAGSGMQGETATDTGSFTSIQRAFEKTANRPMTPSEQTQAATHADKVKGLETQVTDLQSKLDTAMKQTAETKTAVRTGTNKSNKISLPSDPVELRKALAEMRAKGGLFNSGKGIIEVKPGAKTGAVNFGSKPQFIPEVARAIWNHAKENYIDKGVDFPTTVNGVASDLGLTHDEVMGAFAQNKYVKDITDEMYRKMSARRDAVNQAKRFIETSNQSKAAKTWNTVTNLPRGIAVFGHGSVGMVTHAGPNMFRPSAWTTYWPGVINQFKYWDPLHPINGGITHEQAMLRLENHKEFTPWERSGLDINPNKIYDDYQIYGKFIGPVGRAGNRGMDALKTFRFEYANKIWESIPESTRQLPGMREFVAQWVNHASGVGSLDHGKMAAAVHEAMFAGSLEASRWARTLGDPIKTAKTYTKALAAKTGQVEPPTPAEMAIAHFRVRQAVELAAVFTGALAANNGLLVSTNQKDRINMLHPTQSDWLKFKWNGKTFDPMGNLNGPIRFLAQLLAEANPNRTPAAWEHGEKRSELMTQTAGQYIRGKLAPQYGIAADVATGADAIGRPLPWAKESGKPSAPKYTAVEYGMKHAPLPFAGAAEAVYEAMREKGANDAEARGWVDKLTKYGGTFAKTLGTEMTGIRVGKPSKPFIPASKGSGVSYKSPKF